MQQDEIEVELRERQGLATLNTAWRTLHYIQAAPGRLQKWQLRWRLGAPEWVELCNLPPTQYLSPVDASAQTLFGVRVNVMDRFSWPLEMIIRPEVAP